MANVSEAMHRRISAHLDAGATPTIRGKRVMLKDTVRIKANGDCAPATAEADQPATQRNIDLNISFWNTSRATEHKRNQIFAYERSGQGHTIARMYWCEKILAQPGRKFYNTTPYTQWAVHLPAIKIWRHPTARRPSLNTIQYISTCT